MNQHQYDEPLDDHHPNEWLDWPGNPVRQLFDDHQESSIPTHLPHYKVEHHTKRQAYLDRLYQPLKKLN